MAPPGSDQRQRRVNQLMDLVGEMVAANDGDTKPDLAGLQLDISRRHVSRNHRRAAGFGDVHPHGAVGHHLSQDAPAGA